MFNTTKEFLRHYENKGLLKPEISDKRYRLYGYEDIQKIREIYMFKDLDFSIDEMSSINKEGMSKGDYLHLLKSHHRCSFLIRNNGDRYFLVTDFLGDDDVLTPKVITTSIKT